MNQKAKIAVLGTGTVGRALAAKLLELGHGVTVGTRDPAATIGRTKPDGYGNPPFAAWLAEHPGISLKTLSEAAAEAELLINAMNGAGSIEALRAAGEANLAGKVLIDISNPLDFSKGMPPTLSISNTDSLAEQIQRAFPALKVVKTLNTLNANLMVAPAELADADHSLFLSGNDAEAKDAVRRLLESFGWKDVIDLGDISTARGPEMILPLWLRLWGALGTPKFSIKVVR